MDGAGTIVRELTAPSDPGGLGAALNGTGLVFARVGLEAGPLSAWLYAGLRTAGLPVVLLETRQLRAATRTMPVKTDRSDARAIAQVVRTGWFQAVHVKSELSQELRTLLTGRKLLVAKLRDVENGIRGLLRGFGLKMGAAAERAFPARARELTNGRKSLAAVIEPLLLVRETLLCQRERLHRLVVTATRDDEVCRRLMTVPGVGADLLLGGRRPRAVQPLARLGGAFRADAATLPVRRNRPCRANQQAGRRHGAAGAVRSGQRALDPDQPVVVAQGLGHGRR